MILDVCQKLAKATRTDVFGWRMAFLIGGAFSCGGAIMIYVLLSFILDLIKI